MTTIENAEQAEQTEKTDAAATESTVKYPTYAELVKATWKLAYKLSDRNQGQDGSRNFCVGGTNEFLDAFELPRLGDITDETLDQADDYVDAWLRFKHWRVTGELSPEDDAALRDVLARTIRTTLARKEPDSRAVMNRWLEELGLEALKPPRNRQHYEVRSRPVDGRNRLTETQVRDAINAMFPEADAEVSYY